MPSSPFTAPSVGGILTQSTGVISRADSPQQPSAAQPHPRTHTPSSPPASASPAAPSTPLRQRFLDKVHTPLSPSTPPLTPRSEGASTTKSPRKQVLELGQNAFYFTCEVPRKVAPRKANTDLKKMESPRKGADVQVRPSSPEKSAGRVKDILRRNLFGAPAKVASPGRVSPTRVSPTRASPTRMGGPFGRAGTPARNAGDGCTASEQGKAVGGRDKKEKGTPGSGIKAANVQPSDRIEMVVEVPPSAEMAVSGSPEPPKELLSSETAPSQDTNSSSMPATPIPATEPAGTTISNIKLSTPQQKVHEITSAEVATKSSSEACAPSTQSVSKTPSAFRSDIGALMANLKTGIPTTHTPADVGGVEGMPTPLRKASEKLFAKGARPISCDWTIHNSHRKENKQPKHIDAAPRAPTPKWSAFLDPERCVTPEQTSVKMRVDKAPSTPANGAKRPQSMFYDKTPWSQQSAGGRSSEHARSGYMRTASPGTPTRLRSSIQKEMEHVRESLQRSHGSETSSRRTASGHNKPTAQSESETSQKIEMSNGVTSVDECKQHSAEKLEVNRPSSQASGKTQLVSGKSAAKKSDADESQPKRSVKAAQPTTKARPRSMVISPLPSVGTVKGPRSQPVDRRTTAASRPRSMVILPAPIQTEVVVRTTKAAALRQKATQATASKTLQPGIRTRTIKELEEKPITKAPPPHQRIRTLEKDAPPRIVPRKPVTSARNTAPTTSATTGRKTPSVAPIPAQLSPSKPHLVARKPVPPSATIANPKRSAVQPNTLTEPNHQPRPRVASAEEIAGQIAQWNKEERAKVTSPKPRSAPRAKPPSTPQKRPTSPRKDQEGDQVDEEESYTPVGLPTKLRSPAKSPVKARPAVAATPAKKPTAAPAAALRAPKTPNFAAGAGGVRGGGAAFDPNALRTPSKEIQSALDRAIDAKIAEDARSGREFTPSGNRISDLLARRRG